MSGSSRFEESLMTGTFSPANTPTTAMIPVNLENVRAEIRIDYLRQEYVQITFTVTSEVACNIKLMFNSGNIEIWDVRSLQSKPGCGIMNGYQMVEISNLGDNSYLVLVKKLTAVREELPLEIYIEGNLEYSTNLVIN
jgi:hypothetical protein